MDYKRANGGAKLFQVTATGDTIELATFWSNRNVNDARWLIDLSAFATALQAINDRSFAVALSVGIGDLRTIDFAKLSGNATVVTADPVINNLSSVPEPSTILLLGAGLAGVGLLRRRFKI